MFYQFYLPAYGFLKPAAHSTAVEVGLKLIRAIVQ